MSHTSDVSLTALWHRLEALCTRCNPLLPRGGLLPGLNEDQLLAAEAALGFALPTDLRSAYRHFNGMDQRYFRLFPENHQWMPLLRTDPAVSTASTALESFRLQERLRPGYWADMGESEADACAYSESTGAEFHWAAWHAGRLPVGDPNTDTALLVDTAPPSHGSPGQLLLSDATDGTQMVMPGGFAAAVLAIVEAFEGGRIRYDRDQRGTWVVDGADLDLLLDDLREFA